MMENEEFIRTDCLTIWSQIKHQEKLIQIKRRWLLGLSLSNPEKKLFIDSPCVPESFLREDDLFYENVKSAVKAADGKRVSRVVQDDTVTYDRKRIFRALLSGLDDLNTKGLHLVATTLTQGSVKFEETRREMKKVIRESLRKNFDDDDDSGVFRELSQHLSDPHNFRDMFGTVLPSTPESRVRKVLAGLNDLPLEALIAMLRKLGRRERAPQLTQTKRKESLIAELRRTCKKMLSELGTGDELQGSLAKAMAVPGVSLKLQPGFRNSTATEFYQFSEEIKILQDDIASAIQLVTCRSLVSKPELEHLITLLDPDAKKLNNKVRCSVKTLLTEYLFKCDDMDRIPESLTKALDIINKKSRKKLLKPKLKDEIDEDDEEVECILNVSAQTKQIVWDMFPDNELDLDFADAYVEKMEDEDEADDDDWSSEDHDNHDQVSPHEQRISESVISHSDDNESIGESRLFTSNLPTATTTKGDSNPPCNSSVYVQELETVFSNQGINGDSSGIKRGFHGISTETHEPECNQLHVEPDDLDKQTCNQYLAVQKVCDETSVIARDIVGHMLEEFAQIEGFDLNCDDTSHPEVVEGRQTFSQENMGGSVIVNVIEDLLPSFPKSGLETLRKLVGE